MSNYFDNNNRYQIIYPYTSDKIYVENSITKAANKCYNEIKQRDIKTYIFIVHDIDSGNIFYFNIPKYKKYKSAGTNLPEETNKNDKNDKNLQNDIIVRLNNIEYELFLIKKQIKNNKQNNKTNTCIII